RPERPPPTGRTARGGRRRKLWLEPELLLDSGLELAPGRELRNLARGDGDLLAGIAGIDACAGLASLHAELPEPRKRHLVALLEGVLHRVEHGVEGGASVLLGQAR